MYKINKKMVLPKTLLKALFFLTVLFFALVIPSTVYAIWPVSEPAVVNLGFKQEYTSSSFKSVMHRGVDIKAREGEGVRAPQGGVVSFVGYVPADSSSSNKTMLAISVELSNNKTLTFMPFSEASVSAGKEVRPGQFLGTLAKEGDYSSKETHLHIGLKDNTNYYDPLPLMLPVGPVNQQNNPAKFDSLAKPISNNDFFEEGYAMDVASELTSATSTQQAMSSLGEVVTGQEFAADIYQDSLVPAFSNEDVSVSSGVYDSSFLRNEQLSTTSNSLFSLKTLDDALLIVLGVLSLILCFCFVAKKFKDGLKKEIRNKPIDGMEKSNFKCQIKRKKQNNNKHRTAELPLLRNHRNARLTKS